jgi:hypothetical protein
MGYVETTPYGGLIAKTIFKRKKRPDQALTPEMFLAYNDAAEQVQRQMPRYSSTFATLAETRIEIPLLSVPLDSMSFTAETKYAVEGIRVMGGLRRKNNSVNRVALTGQYNGARLLLIDKSPLIVYGLNIISQLTGFPIDMFQNKEQALAHLAKKTVAKIEQLRVVMGKA